MDLIEKSGWKFTGNGSGRKIYFGLFLCPYCKKLTTKDLCSGRKAQSCGCQHFNLLGKANRTHGDTINGPVHLYRVWRCMKNRCYYKGAAFYHRYGGRGIKICQEWKDNYISFKSWALKNGYKKGLSIDRINSDGDYESSNCQWITIQENSSEAGRKRRSLLPQTVVTIRAMYAGGLFSQSKLGKLFGISQTNVGLICRRATYKDI